MSDIRTLDLNLLKTFDALMDERNVTRAAARLALTQPAVSGMLTRLRQSFDDPLFIRTQRGITPTLRALELALPVKRVLGEVDAMLRPSAFDPSTADLTLNIVATDYALRAIVLPFLDALRPRAPGVRVAVRSADDELIPSLLERGEIDLALVTPQAPVADLRVQRLYDEQYACALRKGHPAASAGVLSLDRFCALDHALVSLAGDAFVGATDVALARFGRQRRVVLSVTSFLITAGAACAQRPRRRGAEASGGGQPGPHRARPAGRDPRLHEDLRLA